MPQRRGEGKTWASIERFDCDVLCASELEWREAPRSERGCTRVDLAPVAWCVDPQKIRRGGYMGRARLPPHTQRDDGLPVLWKTPPEPASDGCPGGWYRSRFVWSLQPFMRMRAEGGQRVSNPMLDRCDDELIMQLVLHFEHEQEAFEAWKMEQILRD